MVLIGVLRTAAFVKVRSEQKFEGGEKAFVCTTERRPVGSEDCKGKTKTKGSRT